MFISQELVLAEKPACHASLRGWSSQCFPSLHYFSNANAPPADCSKVRALKIALCNRRQASTKGNNRNGFDDRQSRIRQSIPLNGQTLAAIDRGSGDGEFFFFFFWDGFFFSFGQLCGKSFCVRSENLRILPFTHARLPWTHARILTHQSILGKGVSRALTFHTDDWNLDTTEHPVWSGQGGGAEKTIDKLMKWTDGMAEMVLYLITWGVWLQVSLKKGCPSA